MIADYQLLDLIAHSPRARICRAQRSRDGQVVAIKIVSARAAAQREITALSTVQHPHLIRLLDHGEDDGICWLALEWLEGGTLEEGAPLSLPDWLRLAQASHAALAALHGQGLLHLDVKPENLMCAADGTWRLIDFGDCQPMPEATAHAMTGSIHTMAPERFGSAPLDARTDLYALGCTLFFALAGRFAHPGELTPQVITSHLHPPDLRQDEALSGLPPAWRGWLLGLLEKDPDLRPTRLPG